MIGQGRTLSQTTVCVFHQWRVLKCIDCVVLLSVCRRLDPVAKWSKVLISIYVMKRTFGNYKRKFKKLKKFCTRYKECCGYGE